MKPVEGNNVELVQKKLSPPGPFGFSSTARTQAAFNCSPGRHSCRNHKSRLEATLMDVKGL